MATTELTVKITPNDKGNPPGQLADADLHFTAGPLDGLKLIGLPPRLVVKLAFVERTRDKLLRHPNPTALCIYSRSKASSGEQIAPRRGGKGGKPGTVRGG